MSAPKYILKKADGPEKAVCAFFNLPQGCRNGANCQFRHMAEAPAPPAYCPPAAPAPAPYVQPIRAVVKTMAVVAAEPADAASGRNAERNGKRKRAREEAAAAAEAAKRKTVKSASTSEESSSEESSDESEEEEGEVRPPVRSAKAVPAAKAPPAKAAPVQGSSDEEEEEDEEEESSDEDAMQVQEEEPPKPKPAPARKSATNPFDDPAVGTRAPLPVEAAPAKKEKAPAAAVKIGPMTVRHIPQLQPPKAPVSTPTPIVQNRPPSVAAAAAVDGEGNGSAKKKKASKKAEEKATPVAQANGHAQPQAPSSAKKAPKAAAPAPMQQLAGLPFSPPQALRAEEPEQHGEDETPTPLKKDKKADKKKRTSKADGQDAADEEEDKGPVHEGHRWKQAVEQTRQHCRFASSYNFTVDREWVRAKKHGPWCKDLPHVLALDCEMCATRDPVSNEQNSKALIRLSVVGGAQGTDDTLIDTLVLPTLPVVDYRSDIHGIKPTDLEAVRFTFRHAQAAMLTVCCDQTVLIGHGLQNDLASLKMAHEQVVDTSFLFQREDSPNDTPALKDLAAAVLGTHMPDVHDSVADARVTLHIARHFQEKGIGQSVPRVAGKKARRTEHLASTLLVHRIPEFVTPEHVQQVLCARTKVVPDSVDDVVMGKGKLSGRTTVRYLSKDHADLTFRTLTGAAKPDKSGLPQKKLMFANNKDYVMVRMMAKAGGDPESPFFATA